MAVEGRRGSGRMRGACLCTEVAWRKDHESERELPAEGTPAEVQSFFFYYFIFGGPFLKALLNLFQSCFCFNVLGFFGRKSRGIRAPRPGDGICITSEGEV